MSLSIHKLAMIMVFVEPIVIASPIGNILFEIACINLTVLESYCAVATLHEVFELAFISYSSLNQNSESFNDIVMPLADVG